MVGEAEGSLLVDQAVARSAVHPDRAAIDDPRSGGAGGFEHRQGPARVAFLGVHGLVRDDPDVRVGREVDDGVAVLHRRAEGVLVEEVPDNGVDRVGFVVSGLLQVVDARLEAGVRQLVDDVRTDEPRATCDQDATHAVSSTETTCDSRAGA